MMYSFILLALSFPRSLSTNIHWVWPSWTQKIKVRIFAFLKQDKLFPSRPNHLSWSSKVRGHSLSDKVASVSYADSCKSQKVDFSNSEVNRPRKYMFCWKGLLGSEGWGETLLLPLLPSYTPPLPFFPARGRPPYNHIHKFGSFLLPFYSTSNLLSLSLHYTLKVYQNCYLVHFTATFKFILSWITSLAVPQEVDSYHSLCPIEPLDNPTDQVLFCKHCNAFLDWRRSELEPGLLALGTSALTPPPRSINGYLRIVGTT